MRLRRNRFSLFKPKRPLTTKFLIVRTVRWVIVPTKQDSINFQRWMQITFLPGAKVAQPIIKIVRCFAKRTIGRKGINKYGMITALLSPAICHAASISEIPTEWQTERFLRNDNAGFCRITNALLSCWKHLSTVRTPSLSCWNHGTAQPKHL